MRWRAVHAAAGCSQLSGDRLCRCAGMSRQNYYQHRRVRQREAVDAQLVLELVRRERCRQPMLGGRKLLSLVGTKGPGDLLFGKGGM